MASETKARKVKETRRQAVLARFRNLEDALIDYGHEPTTVLTFGLVLALKGEFTTASQPR